MAVALVLSLGILLLALALSLPQGEARDAIVTVTYAVVAFSILVQGLTLDRVIASGRTGAATGERGHSVT